MSDFLPPIGHEQPPIIDVFPRQLIRRVPLLPHQLMAPITPAEDVFVLSHLGIPRARAEDWWLDIVGLVESPARLSFEDLRRLPKRELTAFHECAGFPKAPHIATRRYANVRWGGVDLQMLLERIGIKNEARYLWSYGRDRGVFEQVEAAAYLKDMPLSRLPEGDVLVAYELNGESLDSEHGFPLRLVIPGFYGTNSVKWLYRLELSEHRAQSPFTTTFYNDRIALTPDNTERAWKPVWEIAPESVIVAPRPNTVLRNEAIQIWGWAWADDGVADVEVSTNGGESWSLATLESATRWSWQRFTFSWTPATLGTHDLISRAFDKREDVQPLSRARNSAYHVQVTVA
jgi:sulfane dehydrogenase subunit SoxC